MFGYKSCTYFVFGYKLQPQGLQKHFFTDSKEELDDISSTLLPPTSTKSQQQVKKSSRKKNKKAKEARRATSDQASKTIFEMQPCENCDLKSAEIELLKEDIITKEEIVEKLESQISDLNSSLLQKQAVINDLEDQLKSKKSCIGQSGTVDQRVHTLRG